MVYRPLPDDYEEEKILIVTDLGETIIWSFFYVTPYGILHFVVNTF